jgi:uncharacterized repeat protein (TIGR03803 family)
MHRIVAASALWLAISATLSAQTLTTIANFDGADGGNSYSGLIQSTDGNLYGATYYDGAYLGGAIYKVSLSGALTGLYSFCSQPGCPDGKNPQANLVQAANGNFYGTT